MVFILKTMTQKYLLKYCSVSWLVIWYDNIRGWRKVFVLRKAFLPNWWWSIASRSFWLNFSLHACAACVPKLNYFRPNYDWLRISNYFLAWNKVRSIASKRIDLSDTIYIICYFDRFGMFILTFYENKDEQNGKIFWRMYSYSIFTE